MYVQLKKGKLIPYLSPFTPFDNDLVSRGSIVGLTVPSTSSAISMVLGPSSPHLSRGANPRTPAFCDDDGVVYTAKRRRVSPESSSGYFAITTAYYHTDGVHRRESAGTGPRPVERTLKEQKGKLNQVVLGCFMSCSGSNNRMD